MFEYRAEQKELIDLPGCQPETIRQSHKFMRFVNRFLGGTWAVKNFIEYADAKKQSDRPLKILDIGSGSCDIPVSIIKWAKHKNIKIEFTCVEREPYAIKLNQDNRRLSDLSITFVNEDIFCYKPYDFFDYAVTSMFLHHLNDEQINKLISRLRTYTRKGIFINDLHRTAHTYTGCLLMSPFISKEVRHDALVSIKKGFRKNQLKALLDLPGFSVKVKTCLWGRITALLEFKGDD